MLIQTTHMGGRMNRTTIPCPRFLNDDNDLLWLVLDDGTGHVVGHPVHRRICENMWVDARSVRLTLETGRQR